MTPHDAPPRPVSLADLAQCLQARHWRLALGESCTGGLIAARCTDLAGASAWFDRGFVTYSNQAKTEMLGVPTELLEAHGAVSEAVARAMAQGALSRSHADIAVAVTGVAGPDGGSVHKPVGTVWFAWALRGGALHAEPRRWPGDRTAVREATVHHALAGVLARAVPL